MLLPYQCDFKNGIGNAVKCELIVKFTRQQLQVSDCFNRESSHFSNPYLPSKFEIFDPIIVTPIVNMLPHPAAYPH